MEKYIFLNSQVCETLYVGLEVNSSQPIEKAASNEATLCTEPFELRCFFSVGCAYRVFKRGGHCVIIMKAKPMAKATERPSGLKPGQTAPASGQYQQVGPRGGGGREVTTVRGEPLPPTTKPGATYTLVDRTNNSSGKKGS